MNNYYLLVHFTGEENDGEQVYFSVSKDGFHWSDLNHGRPVLYSHIGEMGVRDPFILRTREGDRFFIIATDLKIAAGKGWDVAQHAGSRSIIVWESTDLIHWQKERACVVAPEGAGCAWAPEAIFDPEKDAYMVFWASCMQEACETEWKHRIYCSYTKDFKTFTAPQKYIERPRSVIDTTIVRQGEMFYRFSKDETTSTIHLDAGDSLQGEFREIASCELANLQGVEGPAAYPLPDNAGWCLIVDHFAKVRGYLPLVCKDLSGGEFCAVPESDFSMGESRKRHGSVLTISEEEYNRLLSVWGSFTNPVIPGQFADPDLLKVEGRFYLYPTTDGYDGWSGTKFYAFSSDNLRDWKKEGLLLDLATADVPWAVGSAWAPTICHKNGKFYFYCCGKRPDGVSCIGVAVSDSPASGFVAEDAPLLSPEFVAAEGVDVAQVIDPSIYEEDGRVYLLFGNGRPAIVELGEDMISVRKGTMQNLEGAYDFREAISVLKKDGRYHFTWSVEDTGDPDYHVNYGTSESLYGPITYRYVVLEKKPEADILGTGHHCILKMDEEHFLLGYHRFVTPTATILTGKGFHREVCLGRVVFKDGLMQPVIVE